MNTYWFKCVKHACLIESYQRRQIVGSLSSVISGQGHLVEVESIYILTETRSAQVLGRHVT